MSIRSAMVDIPASNYERVFGHSGPKVDYSESDDNPTESKESKVTLVDENGKKIEKVTFRHKNMVYKQAKELREELRHDLCTKDECRNPTDRNVKKMIVNELKNPKTRAYQMAMKAIGADPEDCSTERLRR